MADPIGDAFASGEKMLKGAGPALGGMGLLTQALQAVFSDQDTKDKLTGIIGALVGAGVTSGATHVADALATGANAIGPTQVAAARPAPQGGMAITQS